MQQQRPARVLAPYCAIAMLAAWAGVARGATPDLVEMTLERILRWDIDSSGVNYNRTTGIYGFGDMTRLADGRIVAYHSPHGGEMPALYEIDPVTGAAALLVQSAAGAGDVVAMTPMAGGDLFGRDNTLNFIRINPATLAWSPVPITGPYRTESMNTGGMATSPAGNIYAWCSGFDVGSGVYAKLFRIDPVAGTATAIGGYEGLSVGVEAMAFTPDGRLFGFTADEVRPGLPLQSNSVYEFNLQTGLPTFVARRDELALVRGVVFLPEPAATAVAILIGAAALGRRGRKGGNDASPFQRTRLSAAGPPRDP